MADGTAPPEGQAAPDVTGAPQNQGDNLPEASPGFNRDTYLQSLPADERDAKAGLPDFVLERDSQRGMLRSTFDRKRTEESREQRLMLDRIQHLESQLSGNGKAPEPGALARAAYEAQSPEEYANALEGLVSSAIEKNVGRVLEGHPVMQQVGRAVAMQQTRQVTEVSDEVFVAAQQSLEHQLAEEGLDPASLEPFALRTLLRPHIELAKAKMGTSKQQAGNDNQPKPPSKAAGPRALPVMGSGTGGGAPPAPTPPAGAKQDRVGEALARVHKKLGLSPEQAAELRSRF